MTTATTVTFEQIFNASPDVQASAPGRVNLLGEHTDYNDGFVLPTAIPQQTTVYLGASPNDRHHIYSQELSEQVSFAPSDPIPQGFSSYVIGCIRTLEQQGLNIPPLNIFVTSSVPIGSGLSSSAALEVAMLRALRSLLHLNIDDVKIAQFGQDAERNFAHVQCGIMDQMASSLADTDHLLFLDTRTLDRELLPFPQGAEVLVIDSGIPRTLAGSGYNQRRAECEEAAKLLNVPALRDVQDVSAIASLPSPLKERARHVITENNRVLEARSGVSAEQFGQLMNASHASLRDDYEVSVEGLDRLVAMLQETPGILGARLTGAGFGGACVALVDFNTRSAQAIQDVLNRYQQAGYNGKILVDRT
ncbi:galactokinase [Leptolyngbya sp. FACHB-17]|uniref:galactokinase n=1 Tax=unclassified Leptolyngbya TaxID=2650499 RepID=UPI0016819104|nr:galactokinase [Leptolyngbya sp. FACHB-17]MBD2080030.1 galactokinase [Leptolyngbya sp. FACHB-17]